MPIVNMEYREQFIRLRSLVRTTKNVNLIKDFFVQYGNCRPLYTDIIINYVEGEEVESPKWLSNVGKVDIRNIVVFLMWKEFETVIDAKEDVYNSESILGEDIENLGTYLETMYCLRQIDYMDSMEPWSYTEWVKYLFDTNGLEFTISTLQSLLISTLE